MTAIDAATTLDLDAARRTAKAAVDTRAEEARQRMFITPGHGQQQEYRNTDTEAHAIKDDPDPQDADYPDLAAERDAQNDALGTNKALAEIGQEVRDRVAALRDDESRIKYARRKAKVLIDEADNPPAIDREKQNGLDALDAL